MHSTMLHICKITYVEELGMIMLLHIRRFVSGICYDSGDGKYWSIHHTHRTFHLVIMIYPQVESSVAWAQISYKR